MEYYCYIWADAFSCYLELLNKLQKEICRTVSTSLAVFLEPLANHQNKASLSLFCSGLVTLTHMIALAQAHTQANSFHLHDLSHRQNACFVC